LFCAKFGTVSPLSLYRRRLDSRRSGSERGFQINMSIGDSVYRNISSVVDNNAVRRVRTVNTHVYWIAADDLSTRANRYSRERERELSRE